MRKGLAGVLALFALGPSIRDYVASPPEVPQGVTKGGHTRTWASSAKNLARRRAARKAATRQKRMLRAKGR